MSAGVSRTSNNVALAGLTQVNTRRIPPAYGSPVDGPRGRAVGRSANASWFLRITATQAVPPRGFSPTRGAHHEHPPARRQAAESTRRAGVVVAGPVEARIRFMSTCCHHVTTPARRARPFQAWLGFAQAGQYRRAWETLVRDNPVTGGARPGLLSPLRDRVQPRRA